jgi:hypothetical protein
MYGLVRKAIETLILRKFGEDRWESVQHKANRDMNVILRTDVKIARRIRRPVGADPIAYSILFQVR